MEISWQQSKRWSDPKTEVLANKKVSLDQLLLELSKYQQDKDPETALRNQPDQLKAYHILRTQEQGLRAEIEQLSQGINKLAPAKGEPSTYSNRFLAMEAAGPDHPEISRRLVNLDAAINTLGKRRAETAAQQASSPYLGFRGCGPCHAPAIGFMAKDQPRQGLHNLGQAKQQFNQSCLPCHVTGVDPSHAADALSVPDDRRGVGCETCHGPGRSHSENPTANHLARTPEPESLSDLP